MKRLFNLLLIFVFVLPVAGDYIKWVDFDIPYESLKCAMEQDIQTSEQEQHLDWIDILSVAACRTGGKCGLKSVKRAASDLSKDCTPEEILQELYKYYPYYHEAYAAVLGGLLGNYSIEAHGEQIMRYGLKAFSPIAEGYSFQHYDDFGAGRSYGFRRKHLGNDLLGAAGTPIVAVESGTIEALGWNQYGGWRVGIRSFDRKRYFYYAHLQKDSPYAPGMKIGDTVNAGDLIGFMGRTGYSANENVNNIEVNHLHFGIQLIFDESQKECNSEIWINVYPLNQLLAEHRSSLKKDGNNWKRVYPYQDLDITTKNPQPKREEYPG